MNLNNAILVDKAKGDTILTLAILNQGITIKNKLYPILDKGITIRNQLYPILKYNLKDSEHQISEFSIDKWIDFKLDENQKNKAQDLLELLKKKHKNETLLVWENKIFVNLNIEDLISSLKIQCLLKV